MTLPPTHAELLLPPPALSGCVMACVARSTLGVALTPSQRLNRFPASPLCSLTWVLEGEGLLLPPGARSLAEAEALAPVSLGGPHAGPSMSLSPGPMRGFMVLLLPDALQALSGLDVSPWRDRVVPAQQVLPRDWQGWLDEVKQAPDDAARLAAVTAFLAPRWAAVRPKGSALLRTYSDWTQALVARAATSGLGRSVRQLERRIKAWSGHSLRELRGLARAEASFLQALAAEREGPLSWAELAQASGYADQSHFCREVRRVTGFAPAEFNARLRDDESLWIYRLWGA